MQPAAPLPRPCFPPSEPCLPRSLPIPSRQGTSLPTKSWYRRAVRAACWCELVAESAEASRRASPLSPRTTRERNAPAASSGRFSGLVKDNVNARV